MKPLYFFQRPPRLEPTRLPHRFGGSSEEVALALDHLSLANRYFGGTQSLLHPMRQLLAPHRGDHLRVLDVGCGRADTPRALVTWARRTGLDLSVVAVDQDPDVVRHAAAASQAFPEIQIVRGDALQLPFRPGSFDYVFSAMLLHYFSSDEAVAVLRSWGTLSSRALLASDVERHWFPCLAIPLLAKISKSSLFREGSRRTVLRGFTPEEMAWLAGQAGFASPSVRRYFPFRLALVGWRDEPDPGRRAPRQW
ncbi:MAG: methyltransferase domain-containing protein [Candidatus Methylomirabilia bacterium]